MLPQPLPLLSIVTTSYNQSGFIEETIQSVINQSYPFIEYIIVDGGSTDGTHEILKKYNENIDVVIIESDRGPADALNKGFSVATGEYFAFLNSDDTYDTNFVDLTLSALLSSGSDLVYSDVRFIDKYSKPITPYRFPLAYAVSVSPKKLLAKACIIPQQGSIWSRRLFDSGIRFNEENTTCWDLEFYVEAVCAGFCIQPVHHCLSNFRLHDSSITGESLFSSPNHINSRANRRLTDHARIKKTLIDHGFSCSSVESYLLRIDNLIRRSFRLLS